MRQMSSGQGIERATAASRTEGLQTWGALPSTPSEHAPKSIRFLTSTVQTYERNKARKMSTLGLNVNMDTLNKLAAPATAKIRQLQKMVQDIKKNDGSLLNKIRRLKNKPRPNVPARDYRDFRDSDQCSDPEYNEPCNDPPDDDSYEPPPVHREFTRSPFISLPRGEYLDSSHARPSRPPKKPIRPVKGSKQLPPEPPHPWTDKEEDYIDPDANVEDDYIEPTENSSPKVTIPFCLQLYQIVHPVLKIYMKNLRKRQHFSTSFQTGTFFTKTDTQVPVMNLQAVLPHVYLNLYRESTSLPVMHTEQKPSSKAFSLDLKRPKIPLPQFTPPKPAERGCIAAENGSTDQDKDADVYHKPWFANGCDRKTADDALLRSNKDGAFMVRKSSGQDVQQPYTLVVFYNGRVYNIPIRFVPSTKQYALGREKKGEEFFSSVSSIIENHQKNLLVLIDSQSNTKDATKLFFPSIRWRCRWSIISSWLANTRPQNQQETLNEASRPGDATPTISYFFLLTLRNFSLRVNLSCTEFSP
ncbi:hypothetical protein CCH79_00001376 [Gambusia affinis]|uniref:SH2 domain-containing protein n=1 Tax=Gambusia affinis TaxID=33528 RepID=A0A315VQM1_GAMAF|nr:hypothetical protein CCH79_00001376 [Gambusia affinis]